MSHLRPEPPVARAPRDFQFRRVSAFIIAKPWGVGSARLLAGLGFEALASTSWGAAIALGRADGELSRETMIEHVRQLSAATDLPLSADLENCYAHEPREACWPWDLRSRAPAHPCQERAASDPGR
jgi:hypothetical protein